MPVNEKKKKKKYRAAPAPGGGGEEKKRANLEGEKKNRAIERPRSGTPDSGTHVAVGGENKKQDKKATMKRRGGKKQQARRLVSNKCAFLSEKGKSSSCHQLSRERANNKREKIATGDGAFPW